jgi:hypothetical protein
MRYRAALRLRSIVLGCGISLVASGCGSIQVPWLSPQPPVAKRSELVAVMPVERSQPPPDAAGSEVDGDAGPVITAAIYGALSGSYEWRFVPDLTVADAMQSVSPLDPDTQRAQALAKAVNADAVIFGSVWRYVERVGTPANVERPASVAFTLRLLSMSSGEVVWEDTFDETQETVGSAVVAWMLFWEDPPHWMTAAELTHVGVDRMIDSLSRRLE